MTNLINIKARGMLSIGFGLALLNLMVSANVLASRSQFPAFVVRDFGAVPRSAHQRVLLKNNAVQKELKITEAQTAEQATVERRFAQESVKARQRQAPRDVAKSREARIALNKLEDAAIIATLTPQQRERLDQIQLQAQGPLAFAAQGNDTIGLVEPPLAERLDLTEDQTRRARDIFQESVKQIEKAASFPIILASGNERPTPQAIRSFVESPKFQAAKDKAGRAARDASSAVIRRIEEILNNEQRLAYRRLLGQPFDFSKLRIGAAGTDAAKLDRMLVADLLGLDQRTPQVDPNFNAKVTHPAYAGTIKRVRVLFDEAHLSLFTANGRYKPFAELITSDGYEVIPSRAQFSPEMLKKGDVLIIVNARCAELMGEAGAAGPAFSEAECEAVRNWITAGGSLLLITGQGSSATAAERLTSRLGVTIRPGATFDRLPSEGGNTRLLFTRQNQLLGDHPIIRGRDQSERVDRVQTFGGTSLIGPPGSIQILKLAETAVDVSSENGKLAPAAGHSQGVAFRVGKGRVVVLAEAVHLSAQVVAGEKLGMNMPGVDNRQLALNIMHWLAGLLEPHEATDKTVR
jgi:hypothetical protein